MEERYARRIVGDFPYPVAKQFIKLRTDECLDPGPLRLKYILSTGESLVRLLGMVVLCECREVLEEGGKPPRSLVAGFGQKLKRPSWGFWTEIVREGLKFLSASGAASLVPQLDAFWFAKPGREGEAAAALGKLLTLRNGLSHDRIKAMLPHEFKALCDETFPPLCSALQAAEFLLDYELTFFSQIEVAKRRKHAPSFVHRFKRISGISDDFYGGKETLPASMDSQTIVLVRIKDRRHVSLDPLLVYEAEAGEAPDIYFFNGMSRPQSAEYAGCNRRGEFESAKSARAGEIAEELAGILGLFAEKTGDGGAS